MSAARNRVLAGIRRGLKRGPLDEAARSRLARPPERGPVPARAVFSDPAAMLDAFCAHADAASATTARIGAWTDLGGEVARYLADHNLPADLIAAPDARLDGLAHHGTLLVRRGIGDPSVPTGISVAFAGIAETGTLCLLSGPDSPVTLNFLPETHIICVEAATMHGAYEDVWDAMRRQGGFDRRSINLITGPSRTADIEQTLQLGAHGPRRLHIVIVG